MRVATILVPTHDHGETLRHSLGSALAQTVTDLEVFVVGDGAPDAARATCAELMRRDPRLRFFDRPKGPRHGEVHRHEALREATGRIVCYLSDDDLLLPTHVETLARALERADFAHSLPVAIQADGAIHAWPADFGRAECVHFLRHRDTLVPLSCGAHTLEFYRRLPHGWRTTPDGFPTDRFMWIQCFSVPGVRGCTTNAPTSLHFASPQRKGWTNDRRFAELGEWERKIAEPRWRKDFERRVLRRTGLSRGWARRWVDAVRGVRAAR